MTPSRTTAALRLEVGTGERHPRRSGGSGARDQAARRGGWVTALQRVPTATVILAVVTMLCIVGLVMVGSASAVISIETYGSPWSIFIRECLWMVLGVVVLVFALRFDYHRWQRLSRPLLVVTFLLLLVVLVPGIGTHAGGSSRWIGIGPIVIQPSELMKLALAIAGSDLITRRERKGGAYRTIVGPLLVLTVSAGGLIIVQPDLGTAVVIGCISLVLLFASGVPMRPILKLGGALVAAALVAGMIDPYRRQRLLSFLNPGAHSSGSGYQVLQSLIGMGSGGVLGVGLGNGREKWGYLPNAHTDFIFSVVGEELGLIGALGVLALLAAFVWIGTRAALRAPDRFGRLLGLALAAWIAAEAVINVGAVVGLLPVTGIPLPFVSYGGSSLVITMLAAGILANIARHERPVGRSVRAGHQFRAGHSHRGDRATAP
ncbi:MAG: putative lipid II flippase FtsW [Acidimicrobiales bacterium]